MIARIHFWHPGMAALSWLDSPSLGLHFNITKPLVVDGGNYASSQPMTIARIWRIDGTYRATAFEGRTITNPRKLTGNTALVELSEPLPQGGVGARFDALVHAGMPHHVALFIGHQQDRIRRLTRMLEIDWVD